MENELNPCPFCGSENIEITQTGKNRLRLKCRGCVIYYEQSVIHNSLEWLKDKMIKHWNKRIDAPICSEPTEKQKQSIINNYLKYQ